MANFFDYDQNDIDSIYSLDIGVESYLKNLIFPNEPDLSRIIYSSNEYTFRQRTDENEGNLNFPYLNYHMKAGGMQFNNDNNWRNFQGYNEGIFMEEIGASIHIMPFVREYECTFWCEKDSEARYISRKVAVDQGSTRNIIEYSVRVNNVDVPLLSRLYIDSNEMDGQFNERDWLEKNKIHSVALDFNVKGYLLTSDFDICIPDTVLFEFTNLHKVTDAFTPDEQYEYVVDHFNQTVHT